MGLFDRKQDTYYDSQPLYTLGNSKTLLVVGLGNIGKEFENNRHNVGFMVVEAYRKSHEFNDWMDKKDLKCQIVLGNVGSTRVILMKPTTMMNLSGEALQNIQRFYKIDNADTLVVYDELDIDFGTIRTRVGGSSAGHNGVKSIIQHIGENFGRIRVGIGPKKPARIATADFVLQNFSDDQNALIPKITREVCAIIDERTVGPIQEFTFEISQ
ncbi:aminoacyl-tRNA hydrolase [Candidatus Saccharibacteria bacterium]|nr:aminoacyl-tRNA hydrolase [Candidatus Saccharibacteria bacterium]